VGIGKGKIPERQFRYGNPLSDPHKKRHPASLGMEKDRRV
jgi:hypothetical protein